MARIGLVGIGIVLVGVLLLTPQEVTGEDAPADAPVDLSAKAIKAWGKTCQKCHAVPDTQFETDRAFLGQIMETT